MLRLSRLLCDPRRRLGRIGKGREGPEARATEVEAL